MTRNRSDSRGSSGRSSFRRSTAPSRPVHTSPSRGASHPAPPPAPAKPSAPAAAPPPPAQGGSVAKDIATTAAGVAIGSAVGHAITSAASGLFGGKEQHTQAQSFLAGLDGGAPCAAEMKQFLKCALGDDELHTCQSFNEALRQCVFKNNVQL